MRKILGVSLLVLLLTGPASAGEIPNFSPAPPPPQSATAAVQEPTDDTTLNGEIHTPGAADSLTEIALDLLALLPSLL